MVNTRRRGIAPAFAAWAGLALTWGAAFSLACRLSLIDPAAGPADGRPSVAAALIGESRTALSGYFYEMADNYFHRGVEHLHEHAFRGLFFQRLSEAVTPTEHVHRGGLSVREIMPWLWLAIRANPHDADLYLVTAYWLAGAVQRPDVAHEVLHEGQYNNPGDYRFRAEQGRIWLKQGELARAQRELDAALAFWPSGRSPDSEDARSDKRAMLIYRGLLHERKGDTARAVKDYEEILRLFPQATGFRDRARMLKEGQNPDQNATQVLNDVLDEDAAQRAECGRQEDKRR